MTYEERVLIYFDVMKVNRESEKNVLECKIDRQIFCIEKKNVIKI